MVPSLQQLIDESGEEGQDATVKVAAKVSPSLSSTSFQIDLCISGGRHCLCIGCDCLLPDAKVWMNSPQRAAIAIDRLMGMRLVHGSTVVRWVFNSPGMTTVDDELAKGLAMEVWMLTWLSVRLNSVSLSADFPSLGAL
jgi:hypothetical protein